MTTSRSTRARGLRPVTLAALSAVAVTVVLGGGLAVARAVSAPAPAASTSPASTSPASTSPASTSPASTSPASTSPASAPGASPAAAASPAAGSGGSTGGTNAAVGVNTTDGRTVYAIRLKIVRVDGPTVAPTNAAVAVNDGCTGCATVAIAFEGVVVTGSPTDFEPTNLALAANVDCSGCTAFADAYQQVVQTSTRVRISADGRRELARIRKDLKDLKQDALTLDELRARVAADEQAFAQVLRTELVPVGHVTDPAPAGPDVSDSPGLAVAPAASASPTPGLSSGPAAADPGPSSTASPPVASPSSSAPATSTSPGSPSPVP